jgi:hypothetical protein
VHPRAALALLRSRRRAACSAQVFDTVIGTSLVTGTTDNDGVAQGMALGERIAVGSAGVHYCWKADISQDPGFGSSSKSYIKPCCSMTQYHLNASLGMTFSSSAGFASDGATPTAAVDTCTGTQSTGSPCPPDTTNGPCPPGCAAHLVTPFDLVSCWHK